MRVLFDQGTPVPIRHALKGHTVRTAREQGWSTLVNGELLRVAEEAGFEILLTTDKDFAYQQNLKGRKIAVVVLGKGQWPFIRAVLPQVDAAVSGAKPGSFTVVDIPDR
jgi:predicted nuclease of predicted toxin-antitoxin system